MPQPRQPFLHDLTSLVAAPTQVWSGIDGDIDPAHGGHGVLHADVRVLSACSLRVDGRPPEHVHTEHSHPEHTHTEHTHTEHTHTEHTHTEHTHTEYGSPDLRFTYLLRGLPGMATAPPDPGLRLDRVRRLRPGELSETITLSSVLTAPVTLTLTLRLAVLGHQVGDSRLTGGRPPSAVCLRRVL